MHTWSIDHIQVETVSWCNRHCSFCPSGASDIERAFMSEEVFDRIVSELQRLQFKGRFAPYLRNEPLIDKRLPRLIAKARAVLPEATFFISSNGDALSPSLGAALFEAGLDRMLINIYDADGPIRTRVEAVISQMLQDQPDMVFVKQPSFPELIGDHRIPGQKLLALVDASDWKTADLTNRAGNVPESHIPNEPLQKNCYRPFRQVYIQYDGNVVLCCCDWRGEVVFGNVMNEDLDTILSGELPSTYRAHLAKRDRNLPLCRSCDFDGQL